MVLMVLMVLVVCLCGFGGFGRCVIFDALAPLYRTRLTHYHS